MRTMKRQASDTKELGRRMERGCTQKERKFTKGGISDVRLLTSDLFLKWPASLLPRPFVDGRFGVEGSGEGSGAGDVVGSESEDEGGLRVVVLDWGV